MPELPEVETIKRALEKRILGKVIKGVEVRLPKIVSLGPAVVSNVRRGGAKKAEEFARRLRGLKIVKVGRRAKMLILNLSNESSLPALSLYPSPATGRGEGEGKKGEKREGVAFTPPSSARGGLRRAGRGEGSMILLVHLKMTGQLIFAKKGERKTVKIFNVVNSRVATLPHRYTHVIFEFHDGSRLYYNDLRQFGYLRLVPEVEVAKVPELNDYGPEPFDRRFTLEYFRSGRRRSAMSIKQYLMDPKVVAGIGNIYSDEILYWAAIRPNRRLRSLGLADWQAVYRVIPKVLRKAIKAQGSSVGDFFKVDGSEGMFGRQHMVYGRVGESCKTCGEEIISLKLGGRTASYCPVCQK